MPRLSLLVLFLLLSACATSGGRPETAADMTARPERVILVSIDGFRPDYLGRGATPTLDRLAREGASGPMRPSFPSVTFPNHYTLVTGLHPDHHGIVGNRFIDPELGVFTMARKESGWWDQAEPIWITAEKAGIRTGTMFWPGSETEIDGVRPSRWVPFDHAMPGDARVDQLLAWLDFPPDQRPRFETLYFDIVDTAGHHYGPDAPETREATASVDVSIGRLVDGLKARGLYEGTMLVIVSDHGMAATSPDRVVRLGDLVDAEAIDVIYSGAAVFLNAKPGREQEVRDALVGRRGRAECWEKAHIPARLVLGSNARVPQIVCVADTGWLLTEPGRDVTRPGGAHGYDNLAPEMRALFIAHGPGVIAGRRLTELDSVDVQPFLARVLGIAAPRGDGRPQDTMAVTAP